MLHKNTATTELLEIAKRLSSIHELDSFRMVGGTSLALQIGHRKSIDIDFFSNEKVNKKGIVDTLSKIFPGHQYSLTQHNIRSTINGVRVELYDDWHTPFQHAPVSDEGIRLANLKDLAAFKLDAIIERREKKDYIDLYFLFKELGPMESMNAYRKANPHISTKSILFALGEVYVAKENKSVMPEMLVEIPWKDIEQSMINASKQFISKARNFGLGM